MKKILLIILLISLSWTAAMAWNDCPGGLINDPYPGQCGDYIDSDNNGICDRSQQKYNLLPIAIILILLYSFTWLLSKKRIIKNNAHKKIWNILLLFTFLPAGVSGILLVIRKEFGIEFSLPFKLLFWHVEVSISMVFIALFHAFWHWNYFKNIFKR